MPWWTGLYIIVWNSIWSSYGICDEAQGDLEDHRVAAVMVSQYMLANILYICSQLNEVEWCIHVH